MIKEKRILQEDSLRSMCIRFNLYTSGTNKEYEHLFSMLRDENGYKNLTTKRIEKIAKDIIEHSSKRVLETEGWELTDMMFCIAERCETYFKEEKKLKKYYYTFGVSEHFPVQNGWVIVEAETQSEAHKIFREWNPDVHKNTLNCAFYYNEEQWKQMNPEENWHGWKCYGTLEELTINPKKRK